MDINFPSGVANVKLAILNTAQKSEKRRLQLIKQNIPCKSGCSACCSRYILVSVAESLVIYHDLVQKGTWESVRVRASRQIQLLKNAQPLAWFKLNQKCPVLDPESEKCLAWETRPPVCSTHFVSSDPKLCDPWGSGSGQYVPINMDDLYEEFQRKLALELAEFGILSLRVALPIGLLLAERINVRSSLDLDKVISLMFHEF
jgi:Fe-S-cluster containining protein